MLLYLFNFPVLVLLWQVRFDTCFQLNEYTTFLLHFLIVTGRSMDELEFGSLNSYNQSGRTDQCW